MSVCVAGEELDISHPMLTELDTSQIIRSYIGVELAAVDGSVSTWDDAETESAANGSSSRDFHSAIDLSSSTDDDDDSDDASLDIRDEACQTGDDDVIVCPASESRCVGYFPMPSARQTKVGDVPTSGADEEMSVWRTLLHSDDSYHSVDSDVTKHKVDGPSWCPEVTRVSVVEMESDDTKVSSGEDVPRESRRRFVRSQSDSSLLSMPWTSRALPAPRSVVVPPQSGTSSDPVGSDCGHPSDLLCGHISRDEPGIRWSSLSSVRAEDRPALVFIDRLTGACRGLSRGRDVAVFVAPVPDVITEDPVGPSDPQSEASPSLSAAEDTSVSGALLSDITMAVQSELPGDATSPATGNQTRNQKTTTDVHSAAAFAEGTASTQKSGGADNLRVKAGVMHRHPVCMDHQVCGLLADFVAHL